MSSSEYVMSSLAAVQETRRRRLVLKCLLSEPLTDVTKSSAGGRQESTSVQHRGSRESTTASGAYTSGRPGLGQTQHQRHQAPVPPGMPMRPVPPGYNILGLSGVCTRVPRGSSDAAYWCRLRRTLAALPRAPRPASASFPTLDQPPVPPPPPHPMGPADAFRTEHGAMAPPAPLMTPQTHQWTGGQWPVEAEEDTDRVFVQRYCQRLGYGKEQVEETLANIGLPPSAGDITGHDRAAPATAAEAEAEAGPPPAWMLQVSWAVWQAVTQIATHIAQGRTALYNVYQVEDARRRVREWQEMATAAAAVEDARMARLEGSGWDWSGGGGEAAAAAAAATAHGRMITRSDLYECQAAFQFMCRRSDLDADPSAQLCDIIFQTKRWYPESWGRLERQPGLIQLRAAALAGAMALRRTALITVPAPLETRELWTLSYFGVDEAEPLACAALYGTLLLLEDQSELGLAVPAELYDILSYIDPVAPGGPLGNARPRSSLAPANLDVFSPAHLFLVTDAYCRDSLALVTHAAMVKAYARNNLWSGPLLTQVEAARRAVEEPPPRDVAGLAAARTTGVVAPGRRSVVAASTAATAATAADTAAVRYGSRQRSAIVGKPATAATAAVPPCGAAGRLSAVAEFTARPVTAPTGGPSRHEAVGVSEPDEVDSELARLHQVLSSGRLRPGDASAGRQVGAATAGGSSQEAAVPWAATDEKEGRRSSGGSDGGESPLGGRERRSRVWLKAARSGRRATASPSPGSASLGASSGEEPGQPRRPAAWGGSPCGPGVASGGGGGGKRGRERDDDGGEHGVDSAASGPSTPACARVGDAYRATGAYGAGAAYADGDKWRPHDVQQAVRDLAELGVLDADAGVTAAVDLLPVPPLSDPDLDPDPSRGLDQLVVRLRHELFQTVRHMYKRLGQQRDESKSESAGSPVRGYRQRQRQSSPAASHGSLLRDSSREASLRISFTRVMTSDTRTAAAVAAVLQHFADDDFIMPNDIDDNDSGDNDHLCGRFGSAAPSLPQWQCGGPPSRGGLMSVAQMSAALGSLRPGLVEAHSDSWQALLRAAALEEEEREEEEEDAEMVYGKAQKCLICGLLCLALLAHRPDLPLRLLRLAPCVAAGASYDAHMHCNVCEVFGTTRLRPCPAAHYTALRIFMTLSFLPSWHLEPCPSPAPAPASALASTSGPASPTSPSAREPAGTGTGRASSRGSSGATSSCPRLSAREAPAVMELLCGTDRTWVGIARQYGTLSAVQAVAAEALCVATLAAAGLEPPSLLREAAGRPLTQPAAATAAVAARAVPGGAPGVLEFFSEVRQLVHDVTFLTNQLVPGGGSTEESQEEDDLDGDGSQTTDQEDPDRDLSESDMDPEDGSNGRGGGLYGAPGGYGGGDGLRGAGAGVAMARARRGVEGLISRRGRVSSNDGATSSSNDGTTSSHDSIDINTIRGLVRDVAAMHGNEQYDPNDFNFLLNDPNYLSNYPHYLVADAILDTDCKEEEEEEGGGVGNMYDFYNHLYRARTAQDWRQGVPETEDQEQRPRGYLGVSGPGPCITSTSLGPDIGSAAGFSRPRQQLGGPGSDPQVVEALLQDLWRVGFSSSSVQHPECKLLPLKHVVVVGGPHLLLALTALHGGDRVAQSMEEEETEEEQTGRGKRTVHRFWKAKQRQHPTPEGTTVCFQPSASARTSQLALGLQPGAAGDATEQVFPPPRGTPGVLLLSARGGLIPRGMLMRPLVPGRSRKEAEVQERQQEGTDQQPDEPRIASVIILGRTLYRHHVEELRSWLVSERCGELDVFVQGLDGLETALLVLAQVRGEMLQADRDLAVVMTRLEVVGAGALPTSCHSPPLPSPSDSSPSVSSLELRFFHSQLQDLQGALMETVLSVRAGEPRNFLEPRALAEHALTIMAARASVAGSPQVVLRVLECEKGRPDRLVRQPTHGSEESGGGQGRETVRAAAAAAAAGTAAAAAKGSGGGGRKAAGSTSPPAGVVRKAGGKENKRERRARQAAAAAPGGAEAEARAAARAALRAALAGTGDPAAQGAPGVRGMTRAELRSGIRGLKEGLGSLGKEVRQGMSQQQRWSGLGQSAPWLESLYEP